MPVTLQQDPIDFSGNVIPTSTLMRITGSDANALITQLQTYIGGVYVTNIQTTNGVGYLTPQQWVHESVATPEQIASALHSKVIPIGSSNITFYQTPSMFQYKITDVTAQTQIENINSQISDIYSNTQLQVSSAINNKSDSRSITETLYNLTIVLNPPALALNPTSDQSNAAIAGMNSALQLFSYVGNVWASQDSQISNLNAHITTLQQQQHAANANAIVYVPGFNWTDPINPPTY